MKLLLRTTHLNRLFAALFLLPLFLFSLAACDSDPTPTPGSAPDPILQPTQTPSILSPTSIPVATDTPLPTETPEPTGPMTALTAFSLLKFRALAWHSDAQLIMLTNVRQGQAVLLLGVALGDSSLSAPTPGGKGENWTLLAASPSSHEVVAFSMDGSQVDMVAEGRVSGSLLASLTASPVQQVAIANLNTKLMKDSDAITASAGSAGSASDASIALIFPGSLGLTLISQAPPLSVSIAPPMAYELFTADPTHPSYAFFDASTGETLRLSNP